MVRVAQCWDDGVSNDVRYIEILRRYRVPATFNLNPGLCSVGDRLPLKALPEVYAGFKVASHCMNHEHPEKVTFGEFLQSALDARHALEDMFQRECPGFAWPYGAYTSELCDAMRKAGFRYGRTTGNTASVGKFDHPMRLHSSCHFLDPGFDRIFNEAKAAGGIFYFWGHTYEMEDDPELWRNIEERIRRLCDDPEVRWCDVIDIVTPA